MSVNRIPQEEIAVVVQGPVFGSHEDPVDRRLTERGLLSVRRHLPRAEIVLSTWQGADTEGLDFDRLILSHDPGAAVFQADGVPAYPTNVNRMIVSTMAGLRATERLYVLKARSDLWLSHAGFLDYFSRHPERSNAARVFQERILVHELVTIYPNRCGPYRYLFLVSDCFQFGCRDDLLMLWDAPLLKRAEEVDFQPTSLLNEQYVWVNCLRKCADVTFTEFTQSTLALHRLAQTALVNNFVVLDRKRFGMEAQKLPFNLAQWLTLYSHTEWLQALARESGREPVDSTFGVTLKRLAYALQQWPRPFQVVNAGLNKLANWLRNRRFQAL